jgi:Domain of unknown function (DUF4832)/Domain of unknown function (DUF4874)/Secretion system C-terminal sorting domain
MKKIFILLFFCCITTTISWAQTTINYTQDSISILQNPERGFCEFSITFASNYSFLTTTYLDNIRATKNHTILFRYFNLDAFLNAPITPTFLANMQSDFDSLRKAGFKVIVRFAYSNVFTPNPPFLDAPAKPLLLSHIGQLKPYLLANADVILTLQNGFWGTWGENYYTDYYGFDGNNSTTAANWADRKEILDSLFTCIPLDRKLSVRTPVKKANYFMQTIPQDSLTILQINNGTNAARVGGHNDCFLADYNDYTFDDTTSEKPFWSAESKYTIMGGETCNDNPIYTNCVNAKNELQRFHWTYCNDLYEPNVIDRWKNNNCFAEIENKLGYRINLVQATMSNIGAIGGTFDYTFQIKNNGYAAPVNPKLIKILAKHLNGIDNFEMIIPGDVRTWFGQSTTFVSGSVMIPNAINIGDYQLYLQLQDSASAIKNDAKYGIRLANINMWNATIGANNLQHTLTIISSPLQTQNLVAQLHCSTFENNISWSILHNSSVQSFDIASSIDNNNFTFYKSVDAIPSIYEYALQIPTAVTNQYYKISANYLNHTNVQSNTVRCNGLDNWQIQTAITNNQIEVSQINELGINIKIFNAFGQKIWDKKIELNYISINASSFARGVYFIKLSNRLHQSTKKIILY